MHLIAVGSNAGVSANTTISIVLAVFGGSGLAGAIIAFLKLKPEANSAAVTQAQGANETLVGLNDRLKVDLEEERTRRIDAEQKLAIAEAQVKQLRDILHGVAIMDDDEHFPPRQLDTPS